MLLVSIVIIEKGNETVNYAYNPFINGTVLCLDFFIRTMWKDGRVEVMHVLKNAWFV